MYYDLDNIDLRYHSPEYIQFLKNQALQMNDVYKDLLNRQTLLNYLNGQPTLREELTYPILFEESIKKWQK